jgi:hypothetical protein
MRERTIKNKYGLSIIDTPKANKEKKFNIQKKMII